MEKLSVQLQEQLSGANRKARHNPTAGNLGRLGMVYHSSADYVKAATCYQLAIKKNSSKWEWSYFLGYLNKEMGESARAVEHFKTVLRENPKAYHAWYYTGEGYQNLGSTDKAEIAFKKIEAIREKKSSPTAAARIDYFPLRTYARYQLARIYLSTGRVDPAEHVLRDILNDNITFGQAYRLLGNVYATRGDTGQSYKYILRANDLFDYSSPVDTLIDQLSLISRSELYLLKQIDEAERMVHPEWAMKLVIHAIQVLPENKYLVSKAVKLFLKMDAGKQIAPYLDKHLGFFKDDYNEIKEVADLLYEKGVYQKALGYYQQAARLKPGEAEIQSSLVLALFNSGMKEESLTYMAELLKKDKKNVRILSNGVYIMLTMGEMGKADAYVAELNRLAPANPKVQQLTGMIAERDGQLSRATSCYERSFSGDPRDLATIQALSDILVRQKMWGKVASLYKKALEYHPNEPYLLEKLGSLLINTPDVGLRNVAEGMEYAERAFTHKASPAITMFSAGKSLSDAYANMGNRQKAYAYLNIIYEMARSQGAPKEITEEIAKKLAEYR
jgi:tetratricopeptide (TPR) repeat protein